MSIYYNQQEDCDKRELLDVPPPHLLLYFQQVEFCDSFEICNLCLFPDMPFYSIYGSF